MKCLLLVAATALIQQNRNEVSPIQKVVQLLTDMHATGEAELQAEKVAFGKFQQFCGDTKEQKADSIAAQAQQIESLQAGVQEFTAEADEHSRNVAQFDQDLAKQQTDLQNLKDERAKEHKEYQEEHADFSESVDALMRAIAALQQQSYDRPSFLQTTAIPAKAKQLLASYLALSGDDDFMSRQAPDANAYEFQSEGIIGLLEKLQQEFKGKVHDSEVEEMNSRHSFEMASQDLADAVAQTQTQIGEESTAANRARGTAAQKAKALSAAQVAKAEDVSFLRDLKVECSDKTQSFIEKQQLRSDELDALEKAIEILNQGAVQGAAAKRTFFMQMSNPWAQKVSQFLTEASKKFNDQQLALLAQRAQQNPFKKVKQMVRDLIDRLLQEANQEAEKKGWCDKELSTNKQTREKLQNELDTIAAQLDESVATAQKLDEEIASLQQDISLLDQQRQEASAQRADEKKQNEATIKEAKEAQMAVSQARAVIADFYAQAGTATAFIQLHRPKMGSPEWNALANPDASNTAGYGQGSEDKVDKGHKAGMQTFGDAYEGQQDSAGGVLSMLDVIASDFANLQADTEAQEQKAQREHDRFMVDTSRDKAVKDKQVEMKSGDSQAAKTRAHSLKNDLTSTDDQARAAQRYFDQLKPQCIAQFSYDDRVKKREEEIASLKDALEILKSAGSA